MTQVLNSAELIALIATGKPVVVDFFAEWCQPCKAMAPAIDSLAEALIGRAEVVKLDIDSDQQIAARYGVRGIPTFIVFKDGNPVATKTGTMAKQAFVSWASAQLGVVQA